MIHIIVQNFSHLLLHLLKIKEQIIRPLLKYFHIHSGHFLSVPPSGAKLVSFDHMSTKKSYIDPYIYIYFSSKNGQAKIYPSNFLDFFVRKVIISDLTLKLKKYQFLLVYISISNCIRLNLSISSIHTF